MSDQNLEHFYGGGGGDGEFEEESRIGGQMTFTDFLNQRNNLMSGGY